MLADGQIYEHKIVHRQDEHIDTCVMTSGGDMLFVLDVQGRTFVYYDLEFNSLLYGERAGTASVAEQAFGQIAHGPGG